MKAWLQRLRRFGTGLALLAMLALSYGQVAAAQELLFPCDEHAAHAEAPAAPQTQHKHHATGSSLVCCSGGTCAVTPPVLASASGRRVDAPAAARYFPALTVRPDGFDAGPAVPPPRYRS